MIACIADEMVGPRNIVTISIGDTPVPGLSLEKLIAAAKLLDESEGIELPPDWDEP